MDDTAPAILAGSVLGWAVRETWPVLDGLIQGARPLLDVVLALVGI
jgi:hypothetical protein